MKIFTKLLLFFGIASFEAKRGAGQDVFEKVLPQLVKPLEDTDDVQIKHFQDTIVPYLSEDDVSCLKVYLDWMADVYHPEGCLTGSEEQYYSKWENIYKMFLKALPSD